MNTIGNYVKIARPDHWIKQLFIIPGMFAAVFLCGKGSDTFQSFVTAFISACFLASENYVINEWLDAAFDKYHPTKKNRPVVSEKLNKRAVYAEYAILVFTGLCIAYLVSDGVLLMAVCFFVMGIVYNVRPFRTKEITYLDVITESLNNAVRFLMGWFAVTSDYLPPVSIVIGYWAGGAFLMVMKRYAEYRMIGDPQIAGRYRKSFIGYSEQTLLISGFFYALMSVFFCGIFMIKYKIELIFAVPVICGLFCYYMSISYKKDSAVQKPEKLYKEKGLMLYLAVTLIVFCILLFWEGSGLDILLDSTLIET